MSVTIIKLDEDTPLQRGRKRFAILMAERGNRLLALQDRARAKYQAVCRPEVIEPIASIRADGTAGRPTERRREFPWHPLEETPSVESAMAKKWEGSYRGTWREGGIGVGKQLDRYFRPWLNR